MSSNHETMTFADFGLQASILRDVADLGYQHPTPIQAKCIPPALEGKDLIGLAQTGTGKTAAFGLPIIQRVASKVEMASLILAPTRELAQQIAAALRELGKSCQIRVAVLVGGVPIKQDYKALQAWPNVLVATPGRLIDHLQSHTVSLSEVEVLAVDEADRMYDMGFMPQITRILESLPKQRQTLMFTATMPEAVEKLVRRHMHNPVRIQIGLTAPAARAEQKLYNVDEPGKMPLLLDLLGKSDGRVLVFARTKRKVERLARSVSRHHRVTRLHGDREQNDRDRAMAGFRDGTFRILIATDIAARGLDVADIEHVINYDFPACPEDYIHRIGRTARAAASGMASSFVTHGDKQCLGQVERLISSKLPMVRIDSSREESAHIPAPVESPSRGSRHSRGRGRSHGRSHGNAGRSPVQVHGGFQSFGSGLNS